MNSNAGFHRASVPSYRAYKNHSRVLFERMRPMHGNRTPDANAVGLALVTVPSFSKKRR